MAGTAPKFRADFYVSGACRDGSLGPFGEFKETVCVKIDPTVEKRRCIQLIGHVDADDRVGLFGQCEIGHGHAIFVIGIGRIEVIAVCAGGWLAIGFGINQGSQN